jgi:hypothetical protein
MKANLTLNGIQPHTLVAVQPGLDERWEVIMEGRAKPALFGNRERALSYAQIWAAVNRPSTVVMYSATGRVQQEWSFDGATRY